MKNNQNIQTNEPARKHLDDDILSLLVCLLIRQRKNKFSAYDITSSMRQLLCDYEIDHQKVRSFVLDFCDNNNYSSSNNGKFTVFFQDVNTALVKNTPPLHKQMISRLSSSVAAKAAGMKAAQIIPTKPEYSNKTVSLQSGKRINITNLVNDLFSDSNLTPKFTKTKDKIIISPHESNSLIGLREIRFRTGFNTDCANIKFKKHYIEITPKK